jgi:hypothetical protein
MRKNGLTSNVSSKNTVSSKRDMQVLNEQSKAYFNFINSLKSESTRKSYTFCIEKFLVHYEKDLGQFLRLPQDEMTNLIIKYFVDNKISNKYKNLMNATLKHACEINDVVLNWKKIKKFISSEKTGNETNGRDRGYTDKEIQKILKFSDHSSNRFLDEILKNVNKMAEINNLKLRYTSLYELQKISIDSRKSLDEIREQALKEKGVKQI